MEKAGPQEPQGCNICVNHPALSSAQAARQNVTAWAVQDPGAGQSGFWREISQVSSCKDTNPLRPGPHPCDFN